MDSFPNSIPAAISTSLLGLFILGQQFRLRGRGPGRGGPWDFLNYLGFFGALTWFLFSMGSVDPLGVLRGGKTNQESKDMAPAEPHDKVEFDVRPESPQSPTPKPPPKITVFFLQPYAKCRFCGDEGFMPLTFAPDPPAVEVSEAVKDISEEPKEDQDAAKPPAAQDTATGAAAETEEPKEPDAAKPVVTEPDAAKPVVTEPDAAKPVVTEPDAAKPVVTEPDAAKPVVTEPDAAKPDAAKPEETGPGAPDAGAKESGEKQADEDAKAEPGLQPRKKKLKKHKERALEKLDLTPDEIDKKSLTFMLRLIHVPGYCLGNQTEQDEPCLKAEREWAVNGLVCEDYMHFILNVSLDDAHEDAKKTEAQLVEMWKSKPFDSLRKALTPLWPRLTESAPENPQAFAYMKHADIFQFTTNVKSFKDFLTKIKTLVKKLSLKSTLARLEPNDSEPVSTKRFDHALDRFKKPRLWCRDGEKSSQTPFKILKEIGICFNHEFRSKKCPLRNTCREKFIFRPSGQAA